MPRSAGILLYRIRDGEPEVLLVHPGGPFWARKDAGAWSIPKGEHDDDEDAQACALREFEEETGTALAPAALADLGTVRLKSGKLVAAWAVEGDLDADAITQQHVRAGVAAALGPHAGVSRGRSRRLVRARRRAREAQPRAGGVPRPAAGSARLGARESAHAGRSRRCGAG